jgi:hypothetical protein
MLDVVGAMKPRNFWDWLLLLLFPLNVVLGVLDGNWPSAIGWSLALVWFAQAQLWKSAADDYRELAGLGGRRG